MTNFVNAILNNEARTENGMKTRVTSASACLDLFFKIGASRGKNILPDFYAAFAEDKELALRIAMWARDVRQGAGERQLFRDIMMSLETNDELAAMILARKVPELGRWDDLLVFTRPYTTEYVYAMIAKALQEGNALTAKWMPRKGSKAVALRNFLGLTPKQYRKVLVSLTDVVETKMCANQWDSIDYEKVPSIASARYKRAFERHGASFAEYVDKVVNGEAKVNAGAVYPRDVLKTLFGYHWSTPTKIELDHIREQWKALPDYMGSKRLLPMVDVSGSMMGEPLEVAVSLGLYIADKAKGSFKDVYLTFSKRPELKIAKGDIISKVNQIVADDWGFNTNIVAAFDEVLSLAVANSVPANEMPEMLLILSDMQFDMCANFDDSAMQMIKRKYAQAGYEVPSIIFWNLRASSGVPVKFNEKGVALVSGYSPSILKSILKAENLDPLALMLDTVMDSRYDLK